MYKDCLFCRLHNYNPNRIHRPARCLMWKFRGWLRRSKKWGHLGGFQWLWDSPATKSHWVALPSQPKGTDDAPFTGIQILFLAQLHYSFITRVRAQQIRGGSQQPEKHYWEWELMVIDMRWRKVILSTGKCISVGAITIVPVNHGTNSTVAILDSWFTLSDCKEP